jgi:steroid 5-alpha reductase family enzyme
LTFFEIYLVGGAAILAMMLLLWLASLALKNASIVDIFWGTAFVLANWVYFLLTPNGSPERKLLISLLVTVWGLRLSFYILWRNHGKPEDFRYQKWRRENGASWWWRSFFQVFVLQGLLAWIISMPLLLAQAAGQPARLGVLDFAGLLLWAVGFFFESVGDWQLARFRANPANRGKVLAGGVWRYTRHPNYFGDSAQWWGFYLVAAAAGGWWSIYSPILMTFLLLRVSGVALLEKTLETRPQYREYIERTSSFIPWFPRKKQ